MALGVGSFLTAAPPEWAKAPANCGVEVPGLTADGMLRKTTSAAAKVPPPPLIVTVGSDVYPEPALVIVKPVTLPLATVAVAVAPLPPPPVIATVGAAV